MASNPTQTMDLTQAMQTLKWMDEERLKDKATISALQERVQQQDMQLGQQAAQIQEMQNALAGIQGVLSKVIDFEQIVSNYKDEMVLQMDQREETRRKEQTEAQRVRQIEYETLTSNLNRLEKDIRALLQLEEDMNVRRAENERLSEALQRVELVVADLSQRSDDRVKAVAYLEEQRRADNRRIGDLEYDATELHKRIETIASKLPLLEETLQKQRTRIEEAIQETKKFEKPIEELRISDFQREQKMKQYMDQGAQVAQEMQRIREQTQGFIEQQQRAKRALDKLEGFEARLARRQNEVAEMQRVAEDRLRRQWEEWQDGRAKQQKKQDVVIEERWRQQGQLNDEYREWLKKMQATTDMHNAQLDTMWEARRADATQALQKARDDYETLTAQLDEQLSLLRGEQ